MTQYYLLCMPGSGGMFVTSLMCHYLFGSCDTRVSNTGHCHDLGQGSWNNTDQVFLIGDHWQDRVYHKPILFSHFTDLDRVRTFMPEIQVVLIDFQQDDVELISKLRTIKAHHPNWTAEEYAKFAGPNWPSYDPNNILDSKIVEQELTHLQIPHTQNWIRQVDRTKANYVLQFKDIIRGNINQAVAKIFGRDTDTAVQSFVEQYQRSNCKYYE